MSDKEEQEEELLKALKRMRGKQSASLSSRKFKVSLPRAPWEEDEKDERKEDGIQK